MLNFLLGPDLKQGPNVTEVSGINFRNFNDDLMTLYGTSTPGKYMFRRTNSNKFVTDNFFLLELDFLITKILQSRNIWSNRKALHQLQIKLRTQSWIKDTQDISIPPINNARLTSKVKMKPYDTQRQFLEQYPVIKKGFHLKGQLLDGKPGSGKAQPLSSRIKVPGGWSTMGDMKIGTKVIAQDGSTTTVTGVFPQGITKVYRIHFADGRYTDCHPDHLWKIHDRRAPGGSVRGGSSKKDVRSIEEARANRWRVVDTLTLIDLFNSESRKGRLYVPLNESEQNTDKAFPLDPYLLGVILGDGGISGRTVRISKPYQQLFDKIQSKLPDWMECDWKDDVTFSLKRKSRVTRNTVADSLGHLDLMGLRSWEKFIPQEYFEGSTEQRLELLRGLLDTDGTVSKCKSISFSSSSKALAEGVQYLVRSLGGIAKLATRTPQYTYKGERKEGQLDYRVHIRHPNPEDLFTLDHKKERAKPTQYSDTLKLKIIDIEERPEEETQCIMVDHPDHLYITDDFIVTHNTALSLMWGVLTGNAKHIILSPNGVVDSIWRNHIENIVFHKKPKLWTTWDKTPPDPNAEYYIFHHEFLRSDAFFQYLDLIFKSANGKGVDIVIDECHNFNELTAKQTQNLIKAFDHYKFSDTLPMSGTPLKAIGREAYTVFAGIDPFFTGNARERFMKSYGLSRDRLNLLLAHRLGKTRYVINSLADMGEEPDLVIKPVKFPGAEKYTLKAIRLEMLTYIQNRAKFYETNMPKFVEFFYRVIDDYEEKNNRDSAVLGEIIKYKKIVHRFRTQGFNSFTDSEDSKFCKSLEEKIEKGIRGEELKSFRSIKSAVKYVGLKIKGEALGNVLGKARMNSIRDIIQYADLPEMINNVEKKTLIFTSYVDVLTECEKYLTGKGFSPITVYGENNDIRDEEIKRFAADPAINPCITTFKSLREGAHMVMANQEILMNAPWRDYELKQTKARIFRQGQDSQTFFWLITLDTGKEENITSRSIDIMQWSADNVNEILSTMCIDVPSLRSVSGDEEFISIMDEEPPADAGMFSPVSIMDLF